MEEFIPGRVYENLIKMTSYRNLKLTEPPLDMETVAQKLNHYEFATINCTRDADDPRGEAVVLISLISPGSKYSNRSADFKKLLPKTIPGKAQEIIFVSDEPLTVHIQKYLHTFRRENPSIHIEHYIYDMFKIEVPKHVSVPLHVVMSKEAVNAICAYYYTTPDRFAKILESSDVQAVWLGLRPGMVVQIVRPSETAGIAVSYRTCIRG